MLKGPSNSANDQDRDKPSIRIKAAVGGSRFIPKPPTHMPRRSKATVYGTLVPFRSWREITPSANETPTNKMATSGPAVSVEIPGAGAAIIICVVSPVSIALQSAPIQAPKKIRPLSAPLGLCVNHWHSLEDSVHGLQRRKERNEFSIPVREGVREAYPHIHIKRPVTKTLRQKLGIFRQIYPRLTRLMGHIREVVG